MLRRIFHVCAALAAVAISGCKDDAVPAGTSGTVSVRVYIDADGSGDPSSADILFPASVVLTASDGSVRSAQADANGLAFFEDVPPGSYAATFSGTVPAGAVLATASSATVVVPFKGGDVKSQFRYVYTPGIVSGRMFRDDNGDGAYTAGIDTPAAGMTITLIAGTDATATPVATTTTDGGGFFIFNTVRPGTYTVRIFGIPTISIVGGTTRTVVVGAAATSVAPVLFTGNLVIPISAVRASPIGATVAFEGTATVGAGVVGTNQLYVQDATGGVLAFGTPTAGIVAGDIVRIIGVTAIFNGELEIVAPAGGALSVAKIGTGPVPAPKAITVAQLVSGAFAGQLIKLTGVKVVSAATSGATSYNVNFGTTAADIFQVRLANTNNVPIPIGFWGVSASYDVVGVDGVFNGVQQVKPRAVADAALSNLNLLTIAAAKLILNDTVTVQGVVTAIRTTFRTDNAYIQDATSGVQIFNLPLSLTLALGDSVRVHGKMTVFSGENEITNNITPTDSIKVFKFGAGPVIAPKIITGAQFLSRAFEGQLVTVQNVTIVTVGNAGGTGTYTVTGTAADGSPMTIFMSAPVGAVPPPAATFTVGSKYHLTGIAVPFGTPSVAELKPRGAADVVGAP